jgi:hypothetical protein
LRPARPLTAKRPAILQTGETCSTTKNTREERGSTKVKVVMRRRFGPLVAIQRREERKRLTLGASERVANEADPPDADSPEPRPAVEPAPDEMEGTPRATPFVEGVCTGVEEGVRGEAEGGFTGGGEGICTGGGEIGAGSAGGGSFGTVGSGTTAGGAGTVTVGTVGTGTVWARACPVRRPTPARTVVTAAALIPE